MGRFTFQTGKIGEDSKSGNTLFLVSVILLWGLGIFTVLISTPDAVARLPFLSEKSRYYFVARQLMFSFMGIIGFLFFAFIPFRLLRKFLGFFVIGSLIFCILPILPFFGKASHGAARWVNIPHLGRFQPSEFAKLAVVMYLANLFDKYLVLDSDSQKEYGLYPMLGLFLFVIVIILQKDFSTSVFIFLVGTVMFFASGAKMSWFLPVMILAVPVILLLIFIEPYRINRLIAFFKPEELNMTTGYQRATSENVISLGGIWGNGVGTGMSVLNIPEIQTDYIFAGWVNAMGLVGVIAYCVVLVFFAIRGYKIAVTTPSRFGSYGSFGFTTLILLQSLINIGVVCGALPTTGIPLPFFSSGGSSMIATFCMCGFILNASSTTDDEDGNILNLGNRRSGSESGMENLDGVEINL
ncbi:MAG: FtsW/RodA/SpoVE family cell cycle protein [Treponema sp.]|nr:FtsW/RodA/SpoVE family cell cycle protein [Treponema sp.]